jgi:hypothetical protein
MDNSKIKIGSICRFICGGDPVGKAIALVTKVEFRGCEAVTIYCERWEFCSHYCSEDLWFWESNVIEIFP